MTLDDWYDWAGADAERRGLPALKPLLEPLREATRQLREAEWNDDARGQQQERRRTPRTS